VESVAEKKFEEVEEVDGFVVSAAGAKALETGLRSKVLPEGISVETSISLPLRRRRREEVEASLVAGGGLVDASSRGMMGFSSEDIGRKGNLKGNFGLEYYVRD
jgi:hypothetical protein